MEPNLFTAEGLAGLVFLVMIGTTVFGALVAANAQRLVRAVAGLCLCFIGVASMYYYLSSPFVAMMELLIYVGAVGVVIVFAIMLAEPRQEEKVGKLGGLGTITASIAGGLVFVGTGALAVKTHWTAAVSRANDGSIAEVGKALLTSYSMVFELVSVVLLVAIIGALAIARRGRDA